MENHTFLSLPQNILGLGAISCIDVSLSTVTSYVLFPEQLSNPLSLFLKMIVIPLVCVPITLTRNTSSFFPPSQFAAAVWNSKCHTVSSLLADSPAAHRGFSVSCLGCHGFPDAVPSSLSSFLRDLYDQTESSRKALITSPLCSNAFDGSSFSSYWRSNAALGHPSPPTRVLFPLPQADFLSLLWKAYQTQWELRLAAMKTLPLHKAPHNMSPVLRSWLSPSTTGPLGCLRAQAGMPRSSHRSGFHRTAPELPALLSAPFIRKVSPTSASSTSFSVSKWWLAHTGCQSLTECQHPWNSRQARIPLTRHSTSSPHFCTWVPPSAPNVWGTHPTAYTFQHIILSLN